MGKWLVYLLCLCQIVCLSGCIDGNDPENLEYIITLGVDVAEDGYEFSFVPAKTRTTDTALLSATGKTLAEGVASLNRENPRKTELGQLKMIVLSKEVLMDEGYLTLLAEWERSQDVSGTVMLLATEDTAADCLQAILAGDGETGLFLWDFYENTAEDVAVTWGEDLDGFLSSVDEQNGCGILPKISVTEDALSLGGGLLLVDQKYVSTLNTEDALGYALLCGEGDGAVLVADGMPMSFRIMDNRVSYSVEQMEDMLLCTIEIMVEGDVLSSGNLELFDGDTSDTMEELFGELIKSEVEHTIEVAKDAGALEALGIGRKIRQNYLEFDEATTEFQLAVEVSVDLEDFGRIR